MSDHLDDEARPHPLRRASDFHDPRVDQFETHLVYIREGIDRLASQQGLTDARMYKAEGSIDDLRTRSDLTRIAAKESADAVARVARENAERTDRNIKIFGLILTVVNVGVAVGFKFLS